MRRLVAIILLCMFALNVSGVSIVQHFCGKKFQYVSLNHKKKHSKCCCAGELADKGCCKTKFVKLKLDKQAVAKCFMVTKPAIVEAVLPTSWNETDTKSLILPAEPVLQHDNSPPLSPPVKLHVLYQVFLI